MASSPIRDGIIAASGLFKGFLGLGSENDDPNKIVDTLLHHMEPKLAAEAAFFEQQQLSRKASLNSLAAKRLVSSQRDAECPICLASFSEQRYPRPRIPRGAFDCSHPVCYGCHRRLLLTSGQMESYRCPLCRADGIKDAEDAPPFLRAQMVCGAVVRAREEAVREREERAPTEIRRATRTAAQQVSTLLRLLHGDSNYATFREALTRSANVLVQVANEGEEGEGADALFDGVEIGEEGGDSGDEDWSGENNAAFEEALREQLLREAAAEAAAAEAAEREAENMSMAGGLGAQMQFLRQHDGWLMSSPRSSSPAASPLRGRSTTAAALRQAATDSPRHASFRAQIASMRASSTSPQQRSPSRIVSTPSTGGGGGGEGSSPGGGPGAQMAFLQREPLAELRSIFSSRSPSRSPPRLL